ncbi:MAG: prephenate dehydrogenase [Streptococcus sp.]|nr:prephenate dehydrogenase [Streptococcus sp.]
MEKKVIYIAGLGLIGASLALTIKQSHPHYEVLGYNRGEESRKIALEKGFVDRATGDFKEFVSLADIIILAVPIKQTIEFIHQLATLDLKDNVIISDVGSTKAEIVKTAEEVLSNHPIRFIGGHPMAGSHKTGAIAADAHLFENAYYIFTPSSLTKSGTISEMKELLSGLHSRFVEIDPIEHDKVTSQVSHFPHVLASSLMEQAGFYSQEHGMTQSFAAGGFRDMTRIAESEPGMWTSILMTNPAPILERIEDFKSRLTRIALAIQSKNESEIWDFFNSGRQIRKKMEIHKRAGVDSFYDIFINVPDEEDAVLNILELLRGISVVNIRINEENREDINGILQITFKNREDLEKSAKIVREHTSYEVFLD